MVIGSRMAISNPPDNCRLNFAGWLARAAVASRLVVPLALAIAMLGLAGLVLTPREENPRIEVPAAEITVRLPAATPEEVEHLLLTPLESTLGAIDGVKHTYGLANEGLAQVQVEFMVGRNKDAAMTRIHDAVAAFRAQLPPGASEPLVQRIDVDDVPVFTVTLASRRYPDDALRRIAERMVERLRNVSGVGRTFVIGGQARELRLEASPERMQAFGLDVDSLRRSIGGADEIVAGSAVQVKDNTVRSIRADTRLNDAAEVADVSLAVHEGRTVRVRDVAAIYDGPPSARETMTRFAWGPAAAKSDHATEEMAAVTVAVAKRPGINAVRLNSELRTRVERIKRELLPADVAAVITRDDGSEADATVTRLVEHFLVAVAAVGVILWLSLGARAAGIVMVTIPLVFSFVLGADWLAGPTLNRITVYALILALGLLVDDAIVVIENAERHLPADADKAVRAATIVNATNEIGNPTTLATLTIVTVFLSLKLVTGMLGEYFQPINFNVPVAMLASLLIAYTVTPWAAQRWLGKQHAGNDGQPAFMQSTYRKLALPLIERKRLRRAFLVGVILLFGLSLLQPAWQFLRPSGLAGPVSLGGISLSFLPKDNKNTFLVSLHLPESVPLETTDKAARDIERVLRRQRHVVSFQSYVGLPAVIDFNGLLRGASGRVGQQYAEIRVNLIDKSQRDETSIDIVRALRLPVAEIAAQYPGAVIQLVEDPPGPPVRATVLAEIYGSDSQQLQRTAGVVAGAFASTYDMAETTTSIPAPVAELRVHVDREKASISGIDAAQVTRVLSTLIAGETLGYLHAPDERVPVPIRLKVPRTDPVEPEQLARVFLVGASGRRVPLSELVVLERSVRDLPIQHKNGERVVYVGGELASSAPVYAVLDLDRRLDGLALQDGRPLRTANLRFQLQRPDTLGGYALLWEGELRLTLDAFRDMGAALGLALAAIYLLLVGYYRSFILPLLAMVPIPLALIGVFPGHWLLGTTFSAASMVGVIALAGVVVRNSLLIIDFSRDYQRRGYTADEAAFEAGAMRTRPIMLTTLAIVLGTMVMVPDPVVGGIAISLIFGTAVSAVLTLFVVPLLYRRIMG